MNKEKICELVQKINDILYNKMGITTFKERVILLGCTAIVEKEKILNKNWNDFINCLCNEVSKNDDILVKELKKIKPTLSDNLDNFIDTVKGFHFCYKYKPWNYKSVKDFNNDFYNGLNKPYSKLRTAVVETYLERYILDFSKEI